jgi:putative hydrolase, CocE/NonD family
MEFSRDEVEDMGRIADWIVAQPWSNNRIGLTGISYLGTTAGLALANRHPAIRASYPRHAIFDLYRDVTFTGGVRQMPFMDVWRHTTLSLDQNDLSPFTNLNWLLKGISPVGMKLKTWRKALSQHNQNFDFTGEASKMEYLDEEAGPEGLTMADYSMMSYAQEIHGSGAATCWLTGWYDGALSNSAIKGYLNSPQGNAHLVLGPYDHAAAHVCRPGGPSHKHPKEVVEMDMVRFFDRYLKDHTEKTLPRVRYYTYKAGEKGLGEWRLAQNWPPAG